MKNRVNNFNDDVFDFVTTNKYIKTVGIVVLSYVLSYKSLVNSNKAL